MHTFQINTFKKVKKKMNYSTNFKSVHFVGMLHNKFSCNTTPEA